MPVIALTNSTSEYVVRFRLPLLEALRKESFEVVVISPMDGGEKRLSYLGFEHYPLSLAGAGTNPVFEMRSLVQLARRYRTLKPALALHFTPKVDIYGGLAARWLGIPCINNLSGMGTAITRGGVLGFGVKQLMRATQRSAHHVFVQNPDDEGYVLQTGIVRRERVSKLPGSGIDLDEYRVEPMPGDKQPVHFALIARLVPEKGVIEFMEAARILHRSGVSARFSIAGAIPSGFSGDIDRDALSSWGREPGQQWLGKLNSARDLIASADCVVLPSYYREGTPRVLLEAAAMGRPIIAADSIGTREPLTPGMTGLLCMPRDPNDLARAMQEMVQRGSVRRLEMGLAGRRLMERKYDVNFVVDAYMQKIDEILK